MKHVPIPAATNTQKKILADLARKASRAAGSELLDIEGQIDSHVYALFGLSEEDIALVESRYGVAEPILDAKTALTARVLPELADANLYFSFSSIVDRLDDLEIDIPDDTLRHYLSEAAANKVIHDAGRGWYSRLREPFALDTKPIAPLLRQVKEEFPLLDVSVWSTAQINAYAQHLLSTHTAFVYTESDALPSVAEKLEENGWKVFVNPSPGEAEKRFRPGDKTVVLRPALSKQPEALDGAAPIEKLLVDLLFESPRLNLMDESEVQRIIANVAQAGRIPVAALLGYASRRQQNILFFNESINSNSGRNVDLMD
jgi:hypothetical protein